jgi:hypothetical protein
MRYYCCDLCGKNLSGGDDPRYCIKLEGFAADEDTTLELSDADAIDAMDEWLSEQVAVHAADDDDDTVEMPPVNATREYDLCRGCYGSMLRDPLGRERARTPRFSRN